MLFQRDDDTLGLGGSLCNGTIKFRWQWKDPASAEEERAELARDLGSEMEQMMQRASSLFKAGEEEMSSLYKAGEEEMSSLYKAGEEEIARFKEEMEKRLLQSLAKKKSSENKEPSSFSSGTIVRDEDGNLYKVVKLQSDEEVGGNFASHDGSSSPVLDSNSAGPVLASAKITDAEHNNSNSTDPILALDMKPAEEKCEDDPPPDTNSNISTGRYLSQSLPCKEQQEITVEGEQLEMEIIDEGEELEIIVENVTIDEDDEILQMRSFLRNRVPSHGKWIAPIDTFETTRL